MTKWLQENPNLYIEIKDSFDSEDVGRFCDQETMNSIIDGLLQGTEPARLSFAGGCKIPDSKETLVLTVGVSRILITLRFLDGKEMEIRRAPGMSRFRCSHNPSVFRYLSSGDSSKVDISNWSAEDWSRIKQPFVFDENEVEL